jgi:hypothetical protein
MSISEAQIELVLFVGKSALNEYRYVDIGVLVSRLGV